MLLLALGLGVRVAMPPRADCPAPAEIAEDIETLIGGSPARDIDVRLVVADTAAGVVVELEYTADGQTLTRSIPGATCADVVNAAAVVVAVGVDPIGVQRTLEPVLQRPGAKPEPRVIVEPPPALPRVDEPKQEPDLEPEPRAAPMSAERSPQPPSLGAFVRGGVGAGSLPSPMGWAGGGFMLGLGSLRVELAAQHLFAQRITHPEDPTTGADVSITSARPAACWTPRLGAFTLGGCMGVDLGAVRGGGFGLEDNGGAASLWVGATPGLRAHWQPTRRLSVGLVVDVPISVLRPTLTIDDFATPLVHAGLTGAWAGLSVGFTFFDESPPSRR